jgi:hypothetical protein
MGRNVLLLLLVAAVTLALAVGTGGFSAAELDRGVSVSVSDSDSALVSLYDPGDPDPPDWVPEEATTEPAVVTADDDVPVVYVHNRFADQRLSVTLATDDTDVLGESASVTVESEETEPIPASVDCVGEDREVTTTVVAQGEDVSARVEFTVTVDCRAPSTPTPTATPTDS